MDLNGVSVHLFANVNLMNTKCLIFFAVGSLLERIRLYSPDSLMTVIFCFPPGVSKMDTPLSSSSMCSLIALAVSVYPRIVATSLPTK